MLNDDEMTRRMATGTAEDYFDPDAPPPNHGVEPDLENLSQFNFAAETAAELVAMLNDYTNPCCCCTPTLAAEWRQNGRRVTLLDLDDRYAAFGNFIQYDLRNPVFINQHFDVIVADPPFFLPQPVHHAITTLVGNSRPDLFLVFAADQEDELLALFADWKLQPIDYQLRHHHVKATHQNQFRLYGTAPERFQNVKSILF